ncbi:MAG: LysM peptidoglycan-binding domain-containing protein [Chloroflexi bacterium]|nr:LysM peptidoglycan-binding domain-containing protein [Chloroflexota bacterium]
MQTLMRTRMSGHPVTARYRLLITFALMLVAAGLTAAQDLACGETVLRAFASLQDNCADLPRDSLCYGNAPAQASFAKEDFASDFGAPGALASLIGLDALTTSAEAGRWGLAAINIGAHLPQTYEGPGIIVLLAGDAALVNEVDPAKAMLIPPPLSTIATTATVRYKNPGVIPAPVGRLAAEELVLVDSWDNSGDWLRVVNGGEISWVESAMVVRLNAMDNLPRLALGAAFAMQAFSLSTGTGYPECAEAEPFIAIQTPPDLPANLTINGVDIHLGSMVTFQQVHRNALSMTVHRGEATTIFGQTVQQSETILGILVKTDARDNQVLEWSGALRASDAEFARGERAQAALNLLAKANGWNEFETFMYPEDIIHVVQSGDTLYGLTARYNTSVEGIIAANGGGDDLRLLIGMELIVPKPGSGFAWRGQ